MQQKARWRIAPGAVAVITAIVALAAWLWWPSISGSGGTTADAEQAAAEAARLARSRATADAVAQALQDEGTASDDSEPALCWSNLADFDRLATLTDLRTAIAEALSVGDTRFSEYLSERLAELIGNDPARAAQVLDWVESGSTAEAEVLLAGLSRADASRDPAIANRILALGENASQPEGKRIAAVDALQHQQQLSGESRRRLKKLALEGSSDALAWSATRSLGKVMNEDFKRTGNFKEYWDELLDIGSTSSDPGVRALALEAPAYSDPLLPRDSIAKLADIMSNDSDRDVREMAAFQLGMTESPDDALKAYEKAFENEYDACVRWAILRFAVRAAGQRALPLLQQFAQKDQRFAPDYQDFERLYASGVTDFERIWLEKPERHNCVVEEGQLHGG